MCRILSRKLFRSRLLLCFYLFCPLSCYSPPLPPPSSPPPLPPCMMYDCISDGEDNDNNVESEGDGEQEEVGLAKKKNNV